MDARPRSACPNVNSQGRSGGLPRNRVLRFGVEELSRWSDENLAAQCQGEDSSTPAAELECRFRSRLDGWVGGLACQYRLSPGEREEARQQANLSLLEAIRRFQTLTDGRGNCFGSFLKRVVGSRFQDARRSRRRAERHLDRRRQATAVLEEESLDTHGRSRGGEEVPREDPVEEAERHEAQVLIGRALSQLPGPQRRMAEGWMRGEPLTATAASLGVTYARARQLAADVKRRLGTELRALVD